MALSNPIRLALICLTLDHGGAEHHLLKLATSIDRCRWQTVVIVLDRDARNDLRSHFDEKRIPIVFQPYKRNDVRVIGWLARYLQWENIQVGHSFLWRPDATFSLSAMQIHFRNVVCSERGDRLMMLNQWGWQNWWRRRFDKIVTFRTARHIVSNSQAGAEALVKAGCSRSKIVVIPNGIDLGEVDDARAGVTNLITAHDLSGKLVIGFVGRFETVKQPQVFVAMAKTISERLPDAPLMFVMVGDGPLRPKIESQVRDWGIESRFIFTGRVASSLSWIHGMDLGVVCSRSESFPNVLLEYMACGKPVVATRVGGISELMVDEVTGFIVRHGAVEALSEACLKLIDHPDLRKSMGLAAYRQVQNRYQMSTISNRYLELYEQLVHSGSTEHD